MIAPPFVSASEGEEKNTTHYESWLVRLSITCITPPHFALLGVLLN
jgi:hypothetical protein